jgi:uncharacterized OsmC-like protein
MLLEALVACAGVTLKAVATALGIELRSGKVKAEGELDFRGTLGVDKTAPVGFRDIRLAFEIDTDAPQDQIDTLLKLTERYCVVFQTINRPPQLQVELRRSLTKPAGELSNPARIASQASAPAGSPDRLGHTISALPDEAVPARSCLGSGANRWTSSTRRARPQAGRRPGARSCSSIARRATAASTSRKRSTS